MPAAFAAVRAGTTAFGSLAEIAIALTPWVVASWMNEAWASVAELGPTWVTVAPSSPAALAAPTLAASKYGLLIWLGMNVALGAPDWLAGADAAADADGAGGAGAATDGAAADAAADALGELPELEQAATAIAVTANRAVIRPARDEINAAPPLRSRRDHFVHGVTTSPGPPTGLVGERRPP